MLNILRVARSTPPLEHRLLEFNTRQETFVCVGWYGLVVCTGCIGGSCFLLHSVCGRNATSLAPLALHSMHSSSMLEIATVQ